MGVLVQYLLLWVMQDYIINRRSLGIVELCISCCSDPFSCTELGRRAGSPVHPQATELIKFQLVQYWGSTFGASQFRFQVSGLQPLRLQSGCNEESSGCFGFRVQVSLEGFILPSTNWCRTRIIFNKVPIQKPIANLTSQNLREHTIQESARWFSFRGACGSTFIEVCINVAIVPLHRLQPLCLWTTTCFTPGPHTLRFKVLTCFSVSARILRAGVELECQPNQLRKLFEQAFEHIVASCQMATRTGCALLLYQLHQFLKSV